MKINGWTLTLATAHGVRVWQSEEGLTEVKGLEGLSPEELDQFVSWSNACVEAREFLPVPEWQIGEADIADLLQMDADSFLEGAE